MNASIGSVVTTLTLLVITPGCSGMGNFLFGRGARCGLCNNSAPLYATPPRQPARPQPGPQPCQPNPCVPYQPYGAMPNHPGPAAYPGPSNYPGHCGTCYETYGSAYGGCQCGPSYPSDPYIGGEVMGSYPGEIIEGGEVLTEDEWQRRQNQGT